MSNKKEEMEQIDLFVEFLIKHNAIMFGGYVRDLIYRLHKKKNNDPDMYLIPTDLDLLMTKNDFQIMLNSIEFKAYLNSLLTHDTDYPFKLDNALFYNYRIVKLSEGDSLETKKIILDISIDILVIDYDMIEKNHFPPYENLDFHCNQLCMDKDHGIFRSPKIENCDIFDFQKIVNDITLKKTIACKGVELHRFKKMVEKGWNISYSETNIFNYFIPINDLNIISNEISIEPFNAVSNEISIEPLTLSNEICNEDSNECNICYDKVSTLLINNRKICSCKINYCLSCIKKQLNSIDKGEQYFKCFLCKRKINKFKCEEEISVIEYYYDLCLNKDNTPVKQNSYFSSEVSKI